MNFLTDKIRPIYFKYLAAAFGSALITSIYGVVDAAMVGQYQGPTGTHRQCFTLFRESRTEHPRKL